MSLKKPYKLLFIFIIAIMFVSCSFDSNQNLTGGGSEAGNGKIYGFVVNALSSPVFDAQIRLRTMDYSALSDTLPNSVRYDLKSDRSGYFSFDKIPKGKYLIEVLSAESLGTVAGCTIQTINESVNIGNLTPSAMSSVRGTVHLLRNGAEKVSIAVLGLERMYTLFAIDSFTMVLPAGEFTLDFNIEEQGREFSGTADLWVTSGENRTVELFPYTGPCNNYSCDSLIVRTLLNANKLHNYSVEMFSATNSSVPKRITELAAERVDLTILPDNVGALSQLQVLQLKNNKLSSIPSSIGNCKELQSLDLEGNLLSSLPPEIGELINLTDISVSVNKLVYVPPEIGKLKKLEYISMSANQIVALPDEIGNLINVYHLSFNENRISAIPGSIVNLTNLSAVWLDDNQIESVPAGITGLQKITTFRIRYNRLCSVPQSVSSWISQKDSQWSKSQVCN